MVWLNAAEENGAAAPGTISRDPRDSGVVSMRLEAGNKRPQFWVKVRYKLRSQSGEQLLTH